VTAATGTPENPISDAELQAKFLDLVEPVIGQTAGERIVEVVGRLESLDNVADLLPLTVRHA
jgi:hypothetical protein